MVAVTFLVSSLFLSTAPPCATGTGAAVCCSVNCAAPKPDSTPAKPSYLIEVYDLQKLPKTAPMTKQTTSATKTTAKKPLSPSCAAVKGPLDSGNPVSTMSAGKSYTFSVQSAPGIAQNPSLTANGQQLTKEPAAASATASYKFTPEETGTATFQATATALAGKSCSNPQPIIVKVEVESCDLSLKAQTGSGGQVSAGAGASVASGGSGPAAVAASLLGNPSPLTLKGQGTKIYVYSSTSNATVNKAALAVLHAAIDLLPAETKPARTPPGLRQMEIAIPTRLTAASFANLGYGDFKVSLSHPGLLQIAETKNASCESWSAVLEAAQKTAVGGGGEPHVSRLFYLQSASNAASAISPTEAAKSTPASGAQNPAPSSGGQAASPKDNPSTNASAATKATSSGNDAAAGNGSVPSPGDDASASQQSATGQAPSNEAGGVPSGGAQGNSQTDASQSTNAGSKSAAPPAAPTFSVQGLENDLMVFGGNDSNIREAKRELAMLDLPRPEMIINAWILQASTNNADEIGRFDDVARRFVAQNNDELQHGIDRGWATIYGLIQQGSFFDEDFYRYLSYHYIGDWGAKAFYKNNPAADTVVVAPAEARPDGAVAPASGNTQSPVAPPSGGSGVAKPAGSNKDDEDNNRNAKGICPKGQYCLGYTTLFVPLKPRLTDLLLAIIAANKPVSATEQAVKATEGETAPAPPTCGKECDKLRQQLSLTSRQCRQSGCEKARNPQQTDSDESGGQNEDQGSFLDEASRCGEKDLEQLVNSGGPHFLQGHPARLQLECFRSTIRAIFGDPKNPGDDYPDGVSPAQALARAALADFLFEYKFSQQYPHEFSPYDLTQSADALNTALAPFIEAFNRDVAAFQDYLNNVVRMAVDCQARRAVTFTNTGLVTVRTVSGSPTEVSSTTQSFLDTGSFPTLATLAANVFGAQPGGGTGAAAPKAAGILENLTFNEAQVLTGVLKSFQTTQAQIGRAIDVQVIPRALSGASSSEMNIKLNVDDSGSPSAFTGTASQNFNLSRVATHDTTTHVRVDSLKVFEVSGVGAKLTLSRPPIPLILPGVELPYIGSLVGIPRSPAQEYHSSVAVMSAIVVPTATDLAYGLEFVDDRVILAPPGVCLRPWQTQQGSPSGIPFCKSGDAASHRDLEGSITAFHSIKRECIATGGLYAYPVVPGSIAGSDAAQKKGGLCGSVPGEWLTFDKLTPTF